MSTIHTDQPSLKTTLRVLAHLLDYPDAALRAALPEMRDALHAQSTLREQRLADIDELVNTLLRDDGFDTEAAYVDLFDRGRGTALHLFEHVHGDSRERGPAMIDLIQTYEQTGLYLASDELPDHLTVLLEYASTQPSESAKGLLGEVAHILRNIYSALTRRQSAYAAVLAALLDLAGEPVRAVELPREPGLDESWSEPAAFDGCASQGQRRPGEPQPVRIVRHERSPLETQSRMQPHAELHVQPKQPAQPEQGASA
ncbi:nitrate reductase molybdenum cofactor assembly chaperone [Paraburkholderia diazotrophica]|uniref:nitrate reductase molybdenum cofactor assembly chaperone n=1 Tax=Paraburkholderia diazotrophica TaxID=667676 RepID=UPI00316DCAEB